ncbi:hypothetical protein G7B40_019510 [Aetokthonos hydrillicola Thurmond2011]|jgi:hypothetical protein|uniref:Uncharacterized protein n=1 Tax=Aetokthonos hydrillicola Thurmond2011 TaxID=2712845 RepID=A0AAP5MBE0_9CYAN|nr:hypothetical protein [Aetokthonos hydrillicola]MBO3458908.1 hypothetical protein [Aetokthonos hydrillicola CCALA 1050]MBW4587243.1 hypothetical protein [Aetokthonos hydrillicola CCALA 1050]MDR9896734.1 hypothetical protein [Aetokthonos hydrillicola Thurmond2011]
MIEFNTLKGESVSQHELRGGVTYRVQFLNGFEMLVKFTGFQGSRYNFLTEAGREFSIADTSIQYLKFYKIAS